MVTLALLALAGGGLNRLAEPAWAAKRAREPALRLHSSAAGAGQGLTLALLGGFRTLVADGLWIRMYTLWEQRDLAGTQHLLEFVTTLDPRPLYFWLNGARIMAYDFTAWRVAAAGGYDRIGEEGEEQIGREQGTAALRHLDAGAAFHAGSADFWVERANIQLNRLRDPLAAAESYRRAWEQPRAPYYTARLHAELLRRSGRKAEALEWLRRLHPQLPAGDEAANAPLVLRRIRELETELGEPEERRYQPIR